MPNVSNIVKTIQDIMRKDAGTYGDAQRLEQLGWMFFLKIFDDREKEMAVLRDNYKSPLPKHLRWSKWAADEEGITGDALLDFVNITLLPKLKALTSGGDKIAGLIRMVFEDSNNYMKNGTLMRQVINKVNGIDFNASDDRHMFGDIYEKLLKDLQSAGNAGEFYTPRAVTQFIVEQVNPRLGETVLDPACGTGGFLVCAIEHLRKQAKTEAHERAIQDCFTGIEKKHLPHVLCMTNLLLHGIDIPSNVRHDNTLARPLRDWSPKERVDVIVTNPPFTLSWTHYVVLLTVKNPDERAFYEIEATNDAWSVPELKRQKASALYERLAISRDKAGVKRLAEKGQVVTKPEDVLKDPYVLEFLGLDEEAGYSESDLESAIISQIERFLLELGKGFLFESRQKRFTFDEDHYFVDLVFYNRLLRCYVIIDLKLDKLTHQDLGQMQMYVNHYDRHVKLPDENATIGLLLCKDKKDAVVKLTLPKDANIHAREYQLYLPSKELLKAKLIEWAREEEAKA